MSRIRILAILLIFINLFPSLSYGGESGFPQTSCPSVILIDSDTGQILFEKNSHQKLYPASITKVLTAVIALEKCNMEDRATASDNAVFSIERGSSNASFQPGEEITIRDLLYAMMLNSANEAANIIAEYISGNIGDFAKLMNSRAKELGALNSNFINPNGLFNQNHYTTAYDMALIAKHAMTIPEFRKIVSTVMYKMPDTNKYNKGDKYFLNGNRLIRELYSNSLKNYYYKYATGIKTGYTVKSNHTLVSSASKDGINLIAVALNGTIENGRAQPYIDCKNLFEYAFQNFHMVSPTKTGQVVELAHTIDGQNLSLAADKDVTFLVRNTDKVPYQMNVDISTNIKAPIKKGSVLGSAKFIVDGRTVSQINLLSQTDINPKPSLISIVIKFLIMALSYVIRFLIVLVIILIPVIIILRIRKLRKRAIRKHKKNLLYKKRG